jgi:hypothetical protein
VANFKSKRLYLVVQFQGAVLLALLRRGLPRVVVRHSVCLVKLNGLGKHGIRLLRLLAEEKRLHREHRPIAPSTPTFPLSKNGEVLLCPLQLAADGRKLNAKNNNNKIIRKVFHRQKKQYQRTFAHLTYASTSPGSSSTAFSNISSDSAGMEARLSNQHHIPTIRIAKRNSPHVLQ